MAKMLPTQLMRRASRQARQSRGDVSWPQHVVKIVEAGVKVDRNLEIQKPFERFGPQKRENCTDSEYTSGPSVPPISTINPDDRNEPETQHPFHPLRQPNVLFRAPSVGVCNVAEEECSHVVQPAISPEHSRACPPLMNGNPVDKHTARAFVYPNPVGVKRESWRYSVDSAFSCDKERRENRYSFHGDGFAHLLPMKEVTDPEVLVKIDQIRQRAAAPKVLNPTYESPQRQISDRIPSLMTSVNHVPPSAQVPQFQPPDRPLQPTTTTDYASFNPSTPNGPTPSLSSNVRTPKWIYGLQHSLSNRKQVRVYPLETKAELSERGRQSILSRWTKERLEEKRKEKRNAQIVDEDGSVWKPAHVVLGKIRSWGGPNKSAASGTSASAKVSFGPQEQGATTVRPVRSSATESSLSDLLASGSIDHSHANVRRDFPPHPAHAKIPLQQPIAHAVTPAPVPEHHSATHFPPPVYNTLDSRPTPPSTLPTFAPVSDILTRIREQRSTNLHASGMSSVDAKALLYLFLRRPLPPRESALRANRLLTSIKYFTGPNLENHHSSSLDELVESFEEAYRDHYSMPSMGLLDTMNRVYLLRCLVTKEIIPYALIRKDVYNKLRVFKRIWPICEELGLRPLMMARFMHDEAEVLVFLSTEDDVLYLWSTDWDDKLFGCRRLVRAARTIAECEEGIIGGLHVLDYELGGWLTFDEENPSAFTRDTTFGGQPAEDGRFPDEPRVFQI